MEEEIHIELTEDEAEEMVAFGRAVIELYRDWGIEAKVALCALFQIIDVLNMERQGFTGRMN